MKRINYIADLIKSNSNYVMDVGSDHAYLAIELLKQNKVKFVYNVEINELPLQQGIKNLEKYNLLDKTYNILNNGLLGLESKYKDVKFDYLVVAGMGSNNIIKILEHNKLNFETYILQTNRNEYLLRKWLLKNKYSIKQEHIIYERGIYYVLLEVVKKKNKNLYTQKELKFGKLSKVVNKELYYDYIKYKRDFLINQKLKNKEKELKLLNKLVKKYEYFRNL